MVKWILREEVYLEEKKGRGRREMVQELSVFVVGVWLVGCCWLVFSLASI